MANPIISRILRSTGNNDLPESLERLSLSALNSLLMEVFRRKASRRKTSELMRAYAENRFVGSSAVNPLTFLPLELKLLTIAATERFIARELSPLAPLGSCAFSGFTDQNKIVSALRGTEVVADATNVLALECMNQRRIEAFSEIDSHYCCVHRHVRGQSLSEKGHTAHFKVFCAVSAGRDTGNFGFERSALFRHLSMYATFLGAVDTCEKTTVTLKILMDERGNSVLPPDFCSSVKGFLESEKFGITVVETTAKDHAYYNLLRFSIDARIRRADYNLGDGGFTDWPLKLTGNKKERMLTSGIGTEFLWKILYDRL